jgi:drug/metabolite transporter (DMT)-like permease
VLAIVLALGTSVSYGVSNFLGPRLGRDHPLAAVLIAGQVAALVAAALLVVVAGQDAPPLRAVLLGVLAGAGNALGLAAFYRAASLGPVSVAVAIGGIGTVVPVLWGLGSGESLTALQAAGIVLAVAGATLAAQTTGMAGASAAGAAWALVSGLGLGVLLVALPAAAEDGTAWALLDARVAVVALLAAGIALLRLDVRVERPVRAAPALAVPGLLLLAGTLMYAEAAARGNLSIVAVLASLATVVTVTLAFLVAGERLGRVQQAGVALAICGTVLLAV